ncbi:MAG: hypothetical protein DRJ65_00265 [Acidobacteria bacterium]|nr:MAG: hypothetical protein DRJ65_00265 [Acidobacteriota bacterium]
MSENVINLDPEHLDPLISHLDNITAISATAAEHREIVRLNRLLIAVEADKAETMRAYGDKIKEIKMQIKLQLDEIDDHGASPRLPFGDEPEQQDTAAI